MKPVTTIDGRQVDTYREEWRGCCEAVRVLSMCFEDRKAFLARVEHHRGAAGRRVLEDEMARVEPAYLLAMPDVETRRAYLTRLERAGGPVLRERLQERIVALWEQRKAASATAAA